MPEEKAKQAARKKVTLATLRKMKRDKEPISWLTCYDYPMAAIMDAAGIDMILVGDSGAMTVLGHPTTMPQTLDAQLMLTQAVLRATKSTFVIGDMPYMTYETCATDAIRNAGKFMAMGCDAIKLEGGARIASTIEAMVKAGLPVMGHIGLTPQSAPALGGYRVQGKTADAAKALVADAKALESAGCWGMLVECVPPEAMKMIHESVNIICMSLGAGPDADGQLVIVHDMIGYFAAFRPKFVRKYCDLTEILDKAFRQYIQDVKTRDFPQPEHCYEMSKEELEKLGLVTGD
jgi:3-methyl-2-oxobutanoate hydroxymethyltransferase